MKKPRYKIGEELMFKEGAKGIAPFQSEVLTVVGFKDYPKEYALRVSNYNVSWFVTVDFIDDNTVIATPARKLLYGR